jgi:hypothetical protein
MDGLMMETWSLIGFTADLSNAPKITYGRAERPTPSNEGYRHDQAPAQHFGPIVSRALRVGDRFTMASDAREFEIVCRADG